MHYFDKKHINRIFSVVLSFLLTDPYGYPEEGQEMTVTGEFDTYTENGIVYCFLRDAAAIF